jgi:beta-glucanase (GH16 family)
LAKAKMNHRNSFPKFSLFFICIVFCTKLFSQVYPTDFIYNGCNYTYNGLSFGINDTIKCDDTYQLLFEDNFDGSSLDSINWQKYFPWGRALTNASSGTGFTREYMSDQNVKVSGGYLHLTTQVDPGNRDVYDIPSYDSTWFPPHNNIYFKYTSGMIYSRLNFKSGKFEIRAKIPLIDGLWPAFWLYGKCAQEIDAFEFINSSIISDANTDSENMIMSYHKNNYCSANEGGQCDNGFTRNVGLNLSDDFHIYSVEWNANKIIWKLDSNIVREVYRIWDISPPFPSGPLYGYAVPVKKCSDINPPATYTVFNTFPTEDIKMNIILGTGVGFDRGVYPKEFLIDYVKMYSNADTVPNYQSDPLNFYSLNVYPNPTHGIFSISQSNKESVITDINIINILGESVQDYNSPNVNFVTIDISTLPQGMYILKVVCTNKTYIKKIIYN